MSSLFKSYCFWSDVVGGGPDLLGEVIGIGGMRPTWRIRLPCPEFSSTSRWCVSDDCDEMVGGTPEDMVADL